MRARPLARRAERTARPPRVAIRERKPCFLARRRLFGWNVRFMGFFSLEQVSDFQTDRDRTTDEDEGLREQGVKVASALQ